MPRHRCHRGVPQAGSPFQFFAPCLLPSLSSLSFTPPLLSVPLPLLSSLSLSPPLVLVATSSDPRLTGSMCSANNTQHTTSLRARPTQGRAIRGHDTHCHGSELVATRTRGGERDREERRGRGTDKRGGVKDREEREGNRQGAKNWNGDPA